MDEAIEHVINIFPDHKARIKRLWAVDKDFQEQVQDYALCLDTLTCWAVETVPQVRKAEYVSLRRRLEFEIELRICNVQLHSEGT